MSRPVVVGMATVLFIGDITEVLGHGWLFRVLFIVYLPACAFEAKVVRPINASLRTSSRPKALPSETSTTNQAVAATSVATKHNSLTWRTHLGPVIGGLIGALCLCIGIAVLMTFHHRRRSSATKFWSCRVKTPIPGPEDTHVEMNEKPIIIPAQPTYSRGVISLDIASINEHGHSSAASRLTMGSETTAEFYVNSLNAPSPFSTNFRASMVDETWKK
ncbi:hypothetical protein K443DRAFT_4288 [Laccaria amethystina LaAM-08-1]|uniref:Uncharacterized protein n=1 Tax=Laccaria amethystina LaAM-08-1 TaxID=1095629 RepID=A0A0C9WYQ8_9AGAR|nr:hypothetical protein K443DRAFT_4288 [Laccaria amethystina LaAM-08-1]